MHRRVANARGDFSSFSLPSAGMFLSNVVENIKLEGVEPQSASPKNWNSRPLHLLLDAAYHPASRAGQHWRQRLWQSSAAAEGGSPDRQAQALGYLMPACHLLCLSARSPESQMPQEHGTFFRKLDSGAAGTRIRVREQRLREFL